VERRVSRNCLRGGNEATLQPLDRCGRKCEEVFDRGPFWNLETGCHFKHPADSSVGFWVVSHREDGSVASKVVSRR
jgi:hypothetical protein